MYLKACATNALKYMNFILNTFVSTKISMASMSEENRNRSGVKLLTDFDLLLMVQNSIGGGMYQALHQFAEVNEQ